MCVFTKISGIAGEIESVLRIVKSLVKCRSTSNSVALLVFLSCKGSDRFYFFEMNFFSRLLASIND